MTMRRVIEAVFTALAVGMVPRLAVGQTTGNVLVNGGSATDERGIRSNAMTLAPSVTFVSGTQANLSLLGSATFFQSSAWSLGGGLAANSRGDIGAGFAIALAATGSASRTSYNATFATADVAPTLEWTWRTFTLFGGGRAATGYTQVSSAPSLGPLPSDTQLVSTTRTLYAPVYGARLQLIGDNPSVAGELTYREQPMHVASALITDRTAGAAMLAGPLTIAATAGRREAPDEQVTFGSATVELDVSHGVSLAVGGGRYPSNPLTGAAAGNYVNAGVSLRLGGGQHGLPAPRGVQPPPVGTTRLSIHAADARIVELAGDWDDWKLVPAIRAENGVWYADLQLAPGQYRYAFRIDGHAWRVPRGAVAVNDDFGGKSAYVTVRDASKSDVHDPREDR